MPYQLEISRDMEDNESEVSVLDVYDIASEIGKEFEKMIDVYGTDAVTSLMPKVINALEHLEDLATRDEREKNVVQELRARIAHLENDKVEKAEERLRFEKELEQIEDHWREESKDLLAMVTRLQEENRKLSSSLAEKTNKTSNTHGTVLSPEVDTAVVQRLRALVDKLRDQLRDREKELQIKQAEVDSLSNQVEQLTLVGKEIRRKHRVVQAQVHTLIGERADFLAQVHDQQRELQLLRQRLGLAQKQNEDLACSAAEIPDLTHKVMYDADDPNRPRFTTQELRDILHERNELKARVSDLEDELEMYRPKEVTSPTDDYEDPPVQGPLPAEPDDAPWKKSDSGIRKFFRRLFSESGSSGGGIASTGSVLPFLGGGGGASPSTCTSSGAGTGTAGSGTIHASTPKSSLSYSLSKIGLSGHLSVPASATDSAV